MQPAFPAILLALKEWPERSATQIAEQIGCTDPWVSQIRREVQSSLNLPSRVTGKDGKSYPARRLKLESLIADKAKAQQLRKPSDYDSVLPKSPEQKPINTREELAKLAGVGHGTISQGRLIVKEASEETKEKLRHGRSSPGSPRRRGRSWRDTVTRKRGG